MAEQANTAKPVVIVDNAKVTYRVYASGKAVHEGERTPGSSGPETLEPLKRSRAFH